MLVFTRDLALTHMIFFYPRPISELTGISVVSSIPSSAIDLASLWTPCAPTLSTLAKGTSSKLSKADEVM
jgi:hypothetical protein